MKKLIALSILSLGLMTQAHALTTTGTAWAGVGCPSQESSQPGFRYCTMNLTSVTTVAQIGRVGVASNKVIAITLISSGTAVSNLVTPTINYFLGTRKIASQDVSVSTAGNVVIPKQGNSLGQPLYTAITISASQPNTISDTNTVIVGITENDK